MSWWSWMILGAILLGAELLAIDAQFYLIFLGISAGLVGLAGLFGISMPVWAQWLAFAALSLISMFSFRANLYNIVRGKDEGFESTLAGKSIKVTSDLAAGADGRIEYRGSDWTVVNVGETDIPGGARANIVKVDGLTLHLSADKAEA